MRVDIDEAWCNDQPARVDLVRSLFRDAWGDVGNATSADRDVGDTPRRTSAVEHCPAANDEVVCGAAMNDRGYAVRSELRCGNRCCPDKGSTRGHNGVDRGRKA